MFFKRRRNSYSSSHKTNKLKSPRANWNIPDNYNLIETYRPDLQRRKSKLAWQQDLSLTHRYVNKPSLNYVVRNTPSNARRTAKSLSASTSSPRVNRRTTQEPDTAMPSFREPDAGKRVNKRDELDCHEARGGYSKAKQRHIIRHNGSGKPKIENREPC